jgi:hypothetical protein
MDTNGDGFLSRREFLGTTDRVMLRFVEGRPVGDVTTSQHALPRHRHRPRLDLPMGNYARLRHLWLNGASMRSKVQFCPRYLSPTSY